jgi:hypothetical protein
MEVGFTKSVEGISRKSLSSSEEEGILSPGSLWTQDPSKHQILAGIFSLLLWPADFCVCQPTQLCEPIFFPFCFFILI